MAKNPNDTVAYRDAMIRGLQDSQALRSPRDWVEAVDVPMDLAVALATGRSELLKLAKPRAMDSDDVARLYRLIAVLIDTNMALQAHAHEVAVMSDHFDGQLRGAVKYARRMRSFANFGSLSDEEDGDE